ncbi:metallophosphoesterase family protein [Blastomonas sp.]|uniref:metallophosphoesterase family protein n=1 Tax=Blastomonas sp. TaxID=1909299 RepID=UPI003593E680
MLKALLRRKPKLAPIDTACLPDGRRVYAIGDIHGRRDLLDDLLDQIVADDRARPPADTHIVFLGDLMDRGPDSAGVIDRAMELAAQLGDNVHFLMGNHEEVYLGAATGDEKLVRFFCKIGGRETILSYDISVTEYNALAMDALAERVPALFPRAHVDFVKAFKDQIIMGDYAFVHAGVRPGVPMEQQSSKDLRWIREDFIVDEAPHDKLIVHGHTITEDVEECRNRIGIDTGAYLSGTLTALALEGNDRWYLKTAP